MRLVAPAVVLGEIARAVPADCRENIIIIGSLAAGYHFFGSDPAMMVRTKDADCLLSPRSRALSAGVDITERLFQERWRFRADERWRQPGNASTPDAALPAVRLNPPNTADWFIELLAVPASRADEGPQWTRIETAFGHFGLRSFRFLSLAAFEPIATPLGIHVARPDLMALANLLEHPAVWPETMSGVVGDREIKRSNKDLGRVLAIARLTIGKNEDALLDWPAHWMSALRRLFPEDWRELASRCGHGLRELLAGPDDLDEARHTCEFGLLALQAPTAEQLRLAGLRLLQDAIDPLEQLAREA